MKKEQYKARIIDKKIEEYLRVFGAICIEGPKMCGKTWTSSFHSATQIYLGDPSGNFQNRKFAELDPTLVLEGEIPRLIDEWQEVPTVWDAVRHKVDMRSIKGQFILTGSSTPNHKGILHSGAGRIATLRMRPMSLFESNDSKGIISLEKLCNGNLEPKMTGEVNLKDLINYIIKGGWPTNIELNIDDAAYLPREYLETIIQNDAFKIDGIKRDINKMRLLLRSLARNESTTATIRTLKNDIKEKDDEDIDNDTIAAYLDLFTRLFIIENQQPFHYNIRSTVRVKQAEKRHFVDPSLACAILKITPGKLLNDLETLGFLFESIVERDLRIYAESFNAHLYHYQDYKNREIDAVIELENGEWCAFEIKLGASQIDEAAENLKKIYTEIEKVDHGKLPKIMCIICGLSNSTYRREDGIFVVPFTSLKP